MVSVAQILANHANHARTATITATAQRPSTDIRLISEVRSGRGAMSLSGLYTGADDTQIEVEIIAGDAAALRAGVPVIAGVGNGALTVTGLGSPPTAETVTLSLVAAGEPDKYASLLLGDVTLRAKEPGAAGNALTATVSRAGLVFSATEFATLEAIAEGATALEGPQWDFGAPPATGSGIPATAPRVAFKDYPQVHRHWREWDAARWVYKLDPPPTWEIPANTPVQAISGHYQLTLSDGVTSEVYSGITLYDFLSALQSRSALVDVVGAVVADTAPGGQSVTDLPLRTDARTLPVQARVAGPHAARALADVSPLPTAPTENLIITCLAPRAAGGDTWSVRGGVSGPLPNATTGVLYTAGPVRFTIPSVTLPPSEQGQIHGSVRFTSRDPGQGVPAICLRPMKIGAQATAKTVTFTYEARPPADCDCRAMPSPYLSPACLGLAIDGGPMDYPEAAATRIAAVYAWREGYTRANTAYRAGQPDVTLPGGGTPGTPERYGVRGEFRLKPEPGMVATFELAGPFASLGAAQDAATAVAGTGKTITGSSPIRAGSSVTIDGESAVIRSVPYSTQATLPGVPVGVSASAFTIPGTDPKPGKPDVVPGWRPTFSAASTDLRWMDAAIEIVLPCLLDIVESDEALAAWDDLWTEVQADLALLEATPDDDVSDPNPDFLRRYSATCDNIRIEAGIFPKCDASGQSGGDACWRDLGGSHWWVDQSGEYLPAFSNAAYISARRIDDVPRSTEEFGFGLVVACEDRLKEGDQITITVRGALQGAYTSGDSYTLPVIAGAPALFGGGKDGDPVHTWAVRGSVTGPAPDWLWDPRDAGEPYDAGPIMGTLSAGGIPWEVGDQIRLAIEGGRLRWRRDAGSWTEGDLYAASHDLADGLILTAIPGAAPSFVAGDAWVFNAVATHGANRLRQPREGRAYSWSGAATALELDFGAPRDITTLMLALHTLPTTTTLTLTGGLAGYAEWSEPIAWRGDIILAPLSAPRSARYLRLAIADAGAAGAAIGWLWAGEPWAPASPPSTMRMVRQYGLSRSGGRNPAGIYRGRGTGGRWAWDFGAGAAILSDELPSLLALLDHVAEQGAEWVCLVPDSRAPEPSLAQIDADEVTITDELGYRLPDARGCRSVELPFRAVLL